MLNKIISPLIFIFIATIVLSGCGMNSPSGNRVGNGQTALQMTVNFPPRPAGLTALISASTQTIEIRASNGSTFNPLAIIASTTITAPVGGGPATATLVIPNPGAVVSISIVSKDAAGNWLGEVKEENKAVVIGTTTPIGTVMLEVNQGVNMINLPVASRPAVFAPDGTQYTVKNVYLGSTVTASGSVFNIKVDSDMASGAVASVVTRDTTDPVTAVIRTDSAVINGTISGKVAFFNMGSTTVYKDYIFTLVFSTANSSTPTFTITQAPAGPAAPAPLNTTIQQPVYNNVILQTPAPVGVTASVIGSSQINIDWPLVAGATGYNIYRSAVSGFTTAPVNKIGTASAGPFGNTGLLPATTYYYKVTALNGTVESAPSAEVMATTLPVSTASATATSYYNAITARTAPWLYNVRRNAVYSFTDPVAGTLNNRTDTASGSINIQYVPTPAPALRQTTAITTLPGTANPVPVSSTSTITGTIVNDPVLGIKITTGSGTSVFVPSTMTAGTTWTNNGAMLLFANPNSTWNYTVAGFNAVLPVGVIVPTAILAPNDLMVINATVTDTSIPGSSLTGTATIYMSPSLGSIVYMIVTVSGTIPVPGTGGVVGTATIIQEMIISGGISVVVI